MIVKLPCTLGDTNTTSKRKENKNNSKLKQANRIKYVELIIGAVLNYTNVKTISELMKPHERTNINH